MSYQLGMKNVSVPSWVTTPSQTLVGLSFIMNKAFYWQVAAVDASYSLGNRKKFKIWRFKRQHGRGLIEWLTLWFLCSGFFIVMSLIKWMNKRHRTSVCLLGIYVAPVTDSRCRRCVRGFNHKQRWNLRFIVIVTITDLVVVVIIIMIIIVVKWWWWWW